MDKSDFLSWDDDIDLDILLGDYTDDDEVTRLDSDDSDFEPMDKPQLGLIQGSELDLDKKKKNAGKIVGADYVCPKCGKHLRTIAGFRGHVVKQHDLTNIKASDHKTKAMDSENIPPSSNREQTSTFMDRDAFINVFSKAFHRSFICLKEDSITQEFATSNFRKLVEYAATQSSFMELISNPFLEIFHNTGANISVSADREIIFHKFHVMRTNQDLQQECVKIFCNICDDKVEINHFLQSLYMIIIQELFSEQLKLEQSQAEKNHAAISHNDQTILFYVCGYIIRAIKKKYLKTNLKYGDLLDNCVKSSSSKDSFVSKYESWFEKKDRGGLIKPSDDFFLLVRELETVMRKNTDLENLSAKSLLVDPLKEKMMESFMVKHYSEKLFIVARKEHGLTILEDVIKLFLTVRGHAIARLQRNKLAKEKKEGCSDKKALRANLKDNHKSNV